MTNDLEAILLDSAVLQGVLASRAAQNGNIEDAAYHERRSHMAQLMRRATEANRTKLERGVFAAVRKTAAPTIR